MFNKLVYNHYYRISPSAASFGEIEAVLAEYSDTSYDNGKKNQKKFLCLADNAVVVAFERKPPYIGGCTDIIITTSSRQVPEGLSRLLLTTDAEHIQDYSDNKISLGKKMAEIIKRHLTKCLNQ